MMNKIRILTIIYFLKLHTKKEKDAGIIVLFNATNLNSTFNDLNVGLSKGVKMFPDTNKI